MPDRDRFTDYGPPVEMLTPPNSAEPDNRLRNQVEGPDDIELDRVQRQWERVLNDLMTRWGQITAAQKEQLLLEVTRAIDTGDLSILARLEVDTTEASRALNDAMNELADLAASEVVREAAHQRVSIYPVPGDPERRGILASITAALLGSELSISTGREAMRVRAPGTSGRQVADKTAVFLDGLSTANAEKQLGGSLTAAQNQARIATQLGAPVAALYASEVLDQNTCGPCRAIHGRWLGNNDDPQVPSRILALYPNGGYVDCEGGARCRGTVVSIYRPQQVGDDAP